MEVRRNKDHNSDHPVEIRTWDATWSLMLDEAKALREGLDRAIRETVALRDADRWAREDSAQPTNNETRG